MSFALLCLLSQMCSVARAEEAEPSLSLEMKKDAKNAFYTYNYPSTDAEGNPVVLSSAMIAWKSNGRDDRIASVLVACHVTITSNYECPTSYPTEGKLGTDVGMFQTLPVMGLAYERLRHSIIIMPDYEGYGLTCDRPHPYLAQHLTAQQVVDAVIYGLMLYQQLVEAGTNPDLADDWKSFAIGYSQGGGTALAVHQYVEQNDMGRQLHWAGSICASGPYDPIATMKYYMEDDGTSHGAKTSHRPGTISMPVVLPLIVKGMCDSNPAMKGHQLSDYFSKKFLDTGIIGWIEDKAKPKAEQKTTDDIARLLYDQCEKGLTAADGTQYTAQEMQQLFPVHTRSLGIGGYTYTVTGDMREMFTPACYDYFMNAGSQTTVPGEPGDALGDLHRALVENIVGTDWNPLYRIVFLHSTHDTLVPYDNYESFVASHPDAETRMELLGTGDHLDCATSFFTGMLTTGYKSHFEWLVEGSDVETTSVALPSVGQWTDDYAVYDLSGRRLTSARWQRGVYVRGGRKYVNWK